MREPFNLELVRRILATTRGAVKPIDVETALARLDSSPIYAVKNLFEPEKKLFKAVDELGRFLLDTSQGQGGGHNRWRYADIAQPGMDPVTPLDSSP